MDYRIYWENDEYTFNNINVFNSILFLFFTYLIGNLEVWSITKLFVFKEVDC